MSACIRNKFIIPEKSIPEKRVLNLYVRGKHCGLPGFGFPGSMQTSKWIFTHVGLSAHAHNNYCAQEVEVHGWLISGSEELTVLCCSFLTIL